MYKYALAAFVLLVMPAYSHDIEEGTGVICDTKAQLERFASLDATNEAITVINADAKQNVCAMVEVGYIRVMQVGVAHTTGGAVELVEILVVAVKLHGQWGQIKPKVQYTLFLIEERGAKISSHRRLS